MANFFGYFVWGLILAAPLGWLGWRFQVTRWLPVQAQAVVLPRRRAVHLPPQVGAMVIRGKRQRDSEMGEADE